MSNNPAPQWYFVHVTCVVPPRSPLSGTGLAKRNVRKRDQKAGSGIGDVSRQHSSSKRTLIPPLHLPTHLPNSILTHHPAHTPAHTPAMDVVQQLAKVQDFAKNLRDARFGAIRHPGEFFDYQRVSRPKDMQEYMKRASYNVCVGTGSGDALRMRR